MSGLNDMKQLPREKGDVVCAAGSENKTFWVEIGEGVDLYKTTDGWDAVTIPEGVEVKQGTIQVRSFADVTALTEDPIPFLFSSEADGSGSIKVYTTIKPGAAKKEGILGYVFTGIAGRKIAVISLS